MKLTTHALENMLTSIIHHHARSLTLLKKRPNNALTRSAHRFVVVEQALMNRVAKLLFKQKSQQVLSRLAHAQRSHSKDDQSFDDYQHMYHANTQLIIALRTHLREITDRSLTLQISYWVAAMQMENDEIEKQIQL